MTQRRLGYLLIVSVAVLGLASWIVHRGQPRAESSGAAVLPGLTAALNEVTEVRLSGAGGAHTTIDKGAQRWIVRERGYPADTGKLRKLLIDLGNLESVARKTRVARNYPILGVQNVTSPNAGGARIDVVTPARNWSLIVGHSADGNDCYVRVVDHKQSLLASPLVRVDVKSAQWLAPVIVDLKPSRVSRIEERPGRGPGFVVFRARAGQSDFTVDGIPRGRRLKSPDAADDMAGALSNLTLSDVREATPPPKDTRLSHAVFKTFGGLEVDVEGYQAGKGGKHFIEVTSRASAPKAGPEAARINARVHGWAYQIPDYRYQEIFKPLSGLLAPLPHHGRAHK